MEFKKEKYIYGCFACRADYIAEFKLEIGKKLAKNNIKCPQGHTGILITSLKKINK